VSYDVIIYDVSLIRALFIFLRIGVVIMITSLLTFTTMTTDLNYGLETLMTPLKLIKVPVDMITMMVSLTLRFIPTLLIETDKIMKAQASRGVDFKESKFKEKVNQIISLLVPVFVISFKRSEDLANAMEVRGYVIGQKRTRIDTYKTAMKDYVTLILSFMILIFVVYMVFFR
jgi:energy-coupling factor transport system permease protein